MKVCEKQFPKTQGFYMDNYKKQALDTLAKSIIHDWDHVLLISGTGKVRVGKSVEGQQDGFYLTHKINELHGINNTFTEKNFCWTEQQLIDKGLKAPKYSVLVYDEGAGLSAKDHMKQIVRNLMRFFSEVGQKNLIIIVILPEFFDLPKTIAINRSICLINVDWEGNFQRGYFKFFSWKRKKMLYIKGKKELNYAATKPNFYGRFTNFYTIDEGKYRELKAESLKRFSKKSKTTISTRYKKALMLSIALEKWIKELTGYSNATIARELMLKYKIERSGRQISSDIGKEGL